MSADLLIELISTGSGWSLGGSDNSIPSVYRLSHIEGEKFVTKRTVYGTDGLKDTDHTDNTDLQICVNPCVSVILIPVQSSN